MWLLGIWPWRWKKKEEQDWRMMQLPNSSVWRRDRRRKKSKSGEDDSYHSAQVGPGDRVRKKSKKWIGYLIWIEIKVL